MGPAPRPTSLPFSPISSPFLNAPCHFHLLTSPPPISSPRQPPHLSMASRSCLLLSRTVGEIPARSITPGAFPPSTSAVSATIRAAGSRATASQIVAIHSPLSHLVSASPSTIPAPTSGVTMDITPLTQMGCARRWALPWSAAAAAGLRCAPAAPVGIRWVPATGTTVGAGPHDPHQPPHLSMAFRSCLLLSRTVGEIPARSITPGAFPPSTSAVSATIRAAGSRATASQIVAIHSPLSHLVSASPSTIPAPTSGVTMDITPLTQMGCARRWALPWSAAAAAGLRCAPAAPVGIRWVPATGTTVGTASMGARPFCSSAAEDSGSLTDDAAGLHKEETAGTKATGPPNEEKDAGTNPDEATINFEAQSSHNPFFVVVGHMIRSGIYSKAEVEYFRALLCEKFPEETTVGELHQKLKSLEKVLDHHTLQITALANRRETGKVDCPSNGKAKESPAPEKAKETPAPEKAKETPAPEKEWFTTTYKGKKLC
ncbi:hypothetical protein BRADI_4g28722v3 [Brachypodium distachyon]|uniref:Uncharacterized protein n=1 Tax=Brachypodium distachyon TaxID=15368 RepID=A0A2K2CQY6_BRADI|nr:hypothetical protein BRADI_4g28722v3 [Brachypodium distachyon]